MSTRQAEAFLASRGKTLQDADLRRLLAPVLPRTSTPAVTVNQARPPVTTGPMAGLYRAMAEQ